MKTGWMIVLCILALVSGVSRTFAAETGALMEVRKAAFLNASSCQNVMRSDDERLYLGFGSYLPRESTEGHLEVIALREGADSKVSLKTLDGVVDVKAVGDRLFVLTYSGIEEWSLKTYDRVALYPTYMKSGSFGYKEHATGFYFHGNRFYISHGRLGYSVFDIQKNRLIDQRRLIPEQLPLESMAVDISGAGDKAIIAMDNFTLVKQGAPAFRGFVVLDLNTGGVIKKVSGLDPGVESIQVVGDSVIVGFNPPVWKFNLKEILEGFGEVSPVQRVWRFPGGSHGVKKAYFDEKYMYACFLQSTPSGWYRKKPTVFSRGELTLD